MNLTCCKVSVLLQGVFDLSGSSPRRYLFQVLSNFADNSMHKERLQYFATAEGRDDLYRWEIGGGCCSRITSTACLVFVTIGKGEMEKMATSAWLHCSSSQHAL